MSLGDKLKQAREAAGLSQKQLCGDQITRNMLSQLEHGTANPSMETLTYLAARLNRPVSYFLEEAAISSPNLTILARAKAQFAAGHWEEARQSLEDYAAGDPIFDDEYYLLAARLCLLTAERAASQGRGPYAKTLAERALAWDAKSCYTSQALRSRGLRLLAELAQTPEQFLQTAQAWEETLSWERDRLLLSRLALVRGQTEAALRLLQELPDAELLRGEILLAAGSYEQAAEQLRLAETAAERAGDQKILQSLWPKLEICYRELGNFELAYAYAVRTRK